MSILKIIMNDGSERIIRGVSTIEMSAQEPSKAHLKYRCRSRTLSGKRCDSYTVLGTSKCALHGSNTSLMSKTSLRYRMFTMTLQSFMRCGKPFRRHLKREILRAIDSGDQYINWFAREHKHYEEHRARERYNKNSDEFYNTDVLPFYTPNGYEIYTKY